MNRKWSWFAWLFRKAIAGHLADGLDGIYARGWREAKDRLAEGPFVLAPTHVAYWDSLLLLTIEDLLHADAFALMDRDNYDRMPFFAWLGAVPLDRDRPLTAIRTSVGLLDRPGRMLCVFPQGRQRPAHLRPLDLQRGVEHIARVAKVPVQPVALNYVFHESPKPTVYLDFPESLEAGRDARGFLERLEARLIEGLHRIDAHVQSPSADFEALVTRTSMVRPGLGMRMLGWAARWGDRAES